MHVEEHSIPVTLSDRVPVTRRWFAKRRRRPSMSPTAGLPVAYSVGSCPRAELARSGDIRPGTGYRVRTRPFGAVTVSDPEIITSTIEAACDALQWGTFRWLQMGNHDPNKLREQRQRFINGCPVKTALLKAVPRAHNYRQSCRHSNLARQSWRRAGSENQK